MRVRKWVLYLFRDITILKDSKAWQNSQAILSHTELHNKEGACMHINTSTLHNVYILWQVQKYTGTSLVLLNLLALLFASTFSHTGRDLPLSLVSPMSTPLALAANLFPTLHQFPLIRDTQWRYVMPNEFLVTPHSAFGRTTATSACAMITERQAYTQPIHWAAPASLPLIPTTPPPRPCSTRFSIYQTWLIVWGINLTSFKYSVLGLSGGGGGRQGRGLPWAGKKNKRVCK